MSKKMPKKRSYRPAACGLATILVLLAVGGSGNSAPARGDEERPGYVPTAQEEQLPAELRPQPVFFRTTEPPGTIVVHTQERFLYLVQGEQPRDPLRHRRRARGLPVGGALKPSTASRNGRTGRRRPR